MIYVFTESRSQFESFMHEFRLRAHYGQGGNREGQVIPLYEVNQLRGIDSALVLAWGTWYAHRDADEIQAICRLRDIPFVVIPDLKRQRARRDHPEASPRW